MRSSRPSPRRDIQESAASCRSATHDRCQAGPAELVDKGGSDLHLKVGAAPLFRVNGELDADGGEELTAPDTEGALKQLLTDESKLDEFAREHEVDFSFEIPDVARYRINAFQQRGVISLACRAIPHRISTIEELSLPTSSPNWPTRSAGSCCSPAPPARASRRLWRR